MATLSSIMGNLKAEIEAALLAFTPTEYPLVRFELRQPDEIQMRRIEDTTGRPRVFELGDIESMVVTWCGSSYRGYEVRFPLKVNYPNAPAWQIAAQDDFDRLAEYWRDNNTTVTGVSWRGYDNTTQHAAEQHGEDPWVTNTMTLMALVEITP